MKRIVYIALATVIPGYAGVCAAMYVFQGSLLYYPQPRSVTAPESTMRLTVDGGELVVTVHPDKDLRDIVYFGSNPSRCHAATSLQYDKGLGPDISLQRTPFRRRGFPALAASLRSNRDYKGDSV